MKATKEMCCFCFDVLVNRFTKQPIVDKEIDGEAPLFVTFKKKDESDGKYKLRGCMGTFTKKKLIENLKEITITSAFGDPRFEKITKNELPLLKVEVNLLVKFEAASGGPHDWEIGKHGILLKYGDNQATYLPQVASEQGWNKEETLRQLFTKSGSRGKFSEVVDKIEITRYQSSKIEMSYAEYKKDCL